MRFKNRYFLCEFAWNDPATIDQSISSLTIFKEIRSLVQNNFGEYGFGRMSHSLAVKYWNAKTNIAIIRCPRDEHHMLRAALTFCTNIQKKPVVVHVLHTGGTIRQCQKASIDHMRHALLTLAEKELRPNNGITEPIVPPALIEALKRDVAAAEKEINQLDT